MKQIKEKENNENIPTKITKDESKKIQLLKNEIKHYEKSLSEIEKKIALKKEEEMTQKYIFLSDQIKSKDAELKDLFNSCTELNIQLNDLKEQKIKLLLTYVKKKIKDEGIISQHRKKELLKRFILNKEKNKINNLLLAFKVWHKLTLLQKAQKPLIREKEGDLITMINGEEKIIDGKNIRDGGKINIELKKDEDGKFTIEEIINNNLTEEEMKQEMEIAYLQKLVES